MREIKFRAWDTVEKKMKLPTLLRLCRDLPYTDDNNNGKVFQMQCNGRENIEYFNGRIELMQYTGLKDKNGKEIYEGDIVICPVHEESVDYLQLEAGDKNHVTRTICIPDCYQEGLPEDCEVIGNVHENPELLEVTE
jgi:uncharacterized phage protein (TIGR01671 family)